MKETAVQKYRREQKSLNRKRRDLYSTSDEWVAVQALMKELRKLNGD